MRLKQVLLPNTSMIKIDMNNKMPKGCNKKRAKRLGALRIKNDDIDREDDANYSEDTNEY